MGKHSATNKIVINGSKQDCFDAITQYESFHEWQSAVEGVEILETDGQGRGKVVEMKVDAKFKKIRYRLHYHYDEPNKIWWDFLEGDVKEIGGAYWFEEQGSGRTLATYTVEIDPGFWVPGRMVKMINSELLKRSIEELKERVESKLAGGLEG